MFKLQRLEITGFKSFADYTEIIFTGNGITAVVGPNGCGKSNVADAIAWVLGEQRVKHLRGGEMKDVIFQGARNRAPSGMAEVVMHMVRDEVDEVEPDIEDIDSTLEQIDDRLVNLDEILPEEQSPAILAETTTTETTSTETVNENQAEQSTAVEPVQKASHKRHWRRRNLALEFAPGEAVSVTRRLYRSGESEYLLNDKICRLRDIQDLFSGTGLAGGHYAIIEQGRIGQILSAKPMDRRTIIEEAAGITKFRVRQRATEARLESARSNLSRISDIVAEIDRQVNSLRRQAAKARRYGVLREELRELLRHVYVAEDRKLAVVLEETKARLAEVTELELSIAEDLSKREGAARSATQEARSLEDELSTARAAAAESVLRRDRQARECVYQQEQLSEIEKRKGEVAAEIEALTSRLVLIEAECRRLQQEDARLREESDQSALVLRTAEESYAERLAAANAAEIEIESARSELLSQTAIAERVREIARQLEATLDRLFQQAEGLAREGDRAASQHAERKLEAERFARELGDARARVSELKAERETAVDAVVRGHESVSDIEAELTRVRDEHSRASHKLESLKELDQRRAYYSPAVQLIFSPSETPRGFHFIGTLADALNVEAKWERAVEGVLGSSLQSIVVPTPDDAVRAAQWLRENNGGRASFLVAGLHGGSEEVNTVTALACRLEERPALSFGLTEGFRDDLRICDLLGAPEQLVTVLKRTLPQKMNARLAASLEDAMTRSIATGDMYVTLNGDWIASGQFVNAGDARDLEEGAGLLAFKRELRELETRAETLAREVESSAGFAKEARARLVELEDAVVLLNEAIGREEREAMAREHTTTSLEQEVERAERHMRVVGQDSARVDEERLEVENRRARALLEAEAAEAAREAAADNVIRASALLTDLRRETEIESESLAGQRATAAAAAERRRATSAELRRSEGELTDFAARVDRYRMDLAEMMGRSEDLRLSIADLELAASSVESDRAREEEQIADLSNRLQEARRQADEFSAELSELNRRAAEVRDSRGALEVQRAEAQARQTFFHENCQTELGQALEDLARELTFPEEFDLDASHARVEELRTRLEGFGGVNMMALEELAEAEERLLFLTVQRQDIVDGISATEEALREIKRRSRERFRHAFDQINKNFSALFQELFGGGRGEMSLIEADDVLESGIDVIAQPPGKRLQNVLLLSGGEKAMAALALVLGIFHYRPAPFCLLDEVDAPLDEANVGRFTDKVVQMSADTQFIVITHNKRTMEMARALYGVTMEEAGVSKLVSVKFE
jgi:chromosome segregation protein